MGLQEWADSVQAAVDRHREKHFDPIKESMREEAARIGEGVRKSFDEQTGYATAAKKARRGENPFSVRISPPVEQGLVSAGELLPHSLVTGVGGLAYPFTIAPSKLSGWPIDEKLAEQIAASGKIVRDVLGARGLEEGGDSWEGIRNPRLAARRNVVSGPTRDRYGIAAGPGEYYSGQMAGIDPTSLVGALTETLELAKYYGDAAIPLSLSELKGLRLQGPNRLGGKRPNSGYGFVPPAGSRKKYQKLYGEMPNEDLARLSMNEDLSDTELLYVYQELDRRGITDDGALALLQTPEDAKTREQIGELIESLGPNELLEGMNSRFRNLTPEEVAALSDDELEDMFHFIMDEAEAGNTEAANAMEKIWNDVHVDREMQAHRELIEGGTIDGRSVRDVRPYVGNSREQSIFANELVDSIMNLPPERLDYFDLSNFPHLAQFDDVPDAVKIRAGRDEPIIQSGPGLEHFRQDGPHHLPGLDEDDWRKTFWRHGGHN